MISVPSSLCDLFAQSVQQYPHHLAVDHEDGRLTYRELDDASSALAGDLTRLGVKHGSPVLLVTAHGSFNIIAILSILKAGGCFVPIDRKSWSSDMIEYVCNTFNSQVIINTTAEPFVAADGSHDVLHLTSLPSISHSDGRTWLSPSSSSDDACIIFTSGSTGRPKGVILSHKSLCLYAKTNLMNLDMQPGDRLLHMLSVAFDACACMLFSALGNGGVVVPAQAGEIYAKAPSCTVMAATPAILCTLPEITSKDSIFACIHTVILGGETATSSLLGSWLDAGVRVLIGYGATETASMGSVHVVARDPGTNAINPSLIGSSIEQSPIWLVNSDFQAIDDNFVEGEIIIAGDGISRGYYQDDTKTNDNFVCWNSLRVYKTGDYARWVQGPTGDRVLEFRGRKDRTVKNGGYLVNLDRDVEDALHCAGALLGITSVCAAMTENGIVAVVTPESVDTIALLANARRTMCTYCIPYRIEAIHNFPMSSNGKMQHKRVLEIISSIDRAEDLELNTVMASVSVQQISSTEGIEEREVLSKILSVASIILGNNEGKRSKLKGSDSFFKLGGSSLLAFKLVSALRRLNLHIIPSDLFSYRTFEEIAINSTMNSYSDHKTPVSDENSIITQKLTALRSQAHDILGLEDKSFHIGPLTSLQLALALPTSVCRRKNVNQIKLSYSGTYASMVERAWRAVWHTKAIFRTEICLAVGCGAQIIHRQPFRKPMVGLFSNLTDYETAVEKAHQDIGLSCSLEFIAYYPNPVLESTAAISVPSGVEELTVVLTVHHSLMDGISLQIILDNVELAARGWPLPRSPNSIDSNVELISIQKRRDIDARRFFAEYLKGVRQESSLPKNRGIGIRGHTDSIRQHNTIFFSPSVQSEEIAEFAGQNCISTACIYYTAWAMAISTIQRTSMVVIGSVFSNRASLPEFENVIGLYMSTLPLVVRLDNKEAVTILLRKIMSDIIAVGEYAWARSDQIDIGSHMNNLISIQPSLPDTRSYPSPIRTESLENSEFPLSLLVEANGEFRIMYDNDMFHKNAIQRLGGHFKHALNGILHHNSVGECMKLNEFQETIYMQAERVRIKKNVETIKQALEESVDQFYDLVAIEDCKGNTLTYGQLDKQSNVIASKINESLAGTDAQSVAIYGDGSAEWLLGLIGILKTSRTFVPLDPKWPMERKAMVLEKSGAAVILITNSEQQDEVPKIAGKGAVVIKKVLSDLHLNEDAARLPDVGCADSVFTIIFTSGTTGAPKGIPTTNRAFLAFQSNPEATMFAAPGRRIAQFMSPAFDVCNEEIFSALLHGATLVLRDPEDPYANLSRVDTATMTPTILSVLEPNKYPNLQIVYSTGESITSVINQKFATQKLLYNAYGPAECAISTSFERMIQGDAITIGKPSETARMYILDGQQMHVPKGVQGEICLAGVQVLQQYINAPEQTSLRILPDPWHEGDRMYRTGDYGICGKDGRITFIGRMDRQVKIRGFRVELDAVEQAILSEPITDNISQCSVLAIDGTLVAYVTLNSLGSRTSTDSRINQLRDRLGKTLLPSWVPQLIIPINEFPRSINGKVDNTTLESLYRAKSYLPEETFQRPFLPSNNGDVERKLAEAWREILQLGPNVRLESSNNFFSLGGHSVLAMLLASKLTTIFEVNIAAREILLASSFKEQVDAIESLLKAKEQTPYQEPSAFHMEDSEIGRTLLTEELTELEKQVWLQYQLATTVTAFNISNILTISGQIDYSRLVFSFNTALASDPVLRCNIIEESYGLRRVIRDSTPRVREVEQLDIAAEINFPFNLSQDELIRIHLVRQHEESHFGRNKPTVQIVIVTSHSIADLATLQNLLRLVSAGYSGERVTMHTKPQHLESIQWNYSPSLLEQNFWKSYLAGYDMTKDSRSSYFRSSLLPCAMAAFHGQSHTREFHGNTVIALNSLIKRLGVTHHQVSLAIAALLLQQLLDEDDIVLGAPNANRSSSLEKDALGQFLDRLPIRVKLNHGSLNKAETSLNDILVEVRNSALQALANAIPFSKILETVNVPSGDLRHPIFDCMVTFHPLSTSLDKCLQLPNCHVAASPLFAKGSKFPLMMEWFELDSDRWSLHIEHDTNRLPSTMVNRIEETVQTILGAVAEELSLIDLHARLTPTTGVSRDSANNSLAARPNANQCGPQGDWLLLSVTEAISIIQREMAICLGISDVNVSPSTSFFSLGADSHAAIVLRHRLQVFGLQLPLRAIFAAKSPLELVAHITV